MPNSFGERLKKIRREKGLSQDGMAEMLGTSKQVLSRYETGQRVPKLTVLADYAQKLSVTVNFLLGESGPDNICEPGMKRYPLLGSIACGQPIFADEEAGEFAYGQNNIGADFCLRARGDSMVNARIFDGDIVFIRKQPDVDNGQIAAVLIDDEATLKRVYKSRSGVTLVAENTAYPPMVFTENDFKNVIILGKAVAFQSCI